MYLTTPRGSPASVTFHTGSVTHQSEVPAFATRITLVALHLRFGTDYHPILLFIHIQRITRGYRGLLRRSS